MSLLMHIADRALNRPLLITPDKAQVVLSVLANRIGVDAPDASRFEGSPVERDENGRAVAKKPYNARSGVAIITITGTLVNRGAWIGASSGLTSYEGIGHQLKTALADEAVHSVILDLHTPGGEAVGAFEVAELVRQLAAVKRTVAVVNGMAASAGYAIASGATEIVTTETGVSGSIGVVLLHADYSRWLANEGIKPTLIFAGAHKVDGNPFEPLEANVQSDLQSEVSAFYDLFLKTVAKGRGNRLTAAAARRTEARTFIGAAAVEAGVADRVGTFETVLAELSRAHGGRPTAPKGRTSMADTTDTPAQAGITQAQMDSAVSAARAEGRTAGAQEATARLQAALGAEGVKGDAGRMAAALDLAVQSPAMTGEQVAAFVSTNVAGSKSSDADQLEAERSRGLARPGGKTATADAGRSAWAKTAEALNRRRA